MSEVGVTQYSGVSRVSSCDGSDGHYSDADFGDSEEDALRNGAYPYESVNHMHCSDTVNRVINDCLSHSREHIDGFSKSNSGSLESVDKDVTIVGILGKDKYEAEARLAARRQARAEAREIRMRELERQQKEQEENADKAYDMHAEPLLRAGARGGVGRLLSPAALHSSRRSSEDSLEDAKDVRFELKELEEKFRKTMILNAQLDNDKSSLTYQLDIMKDKLEDIQEQQAQLQRLHREKCSALEISKREGAAMRLEAERGMAALVARDTAATESGLILIALPPDEQHPEGRLAYVSKESEKILEDAGEGTLDVRLQKLHSDKQALEDEVKNLRLQLNSEHSRKRLKWKRRESQGQGANGPLAAEESDGSEGSGGSEGAGRDARRLASDYLYRACRAEQEAAALGATAARLEAQSQRHKAAAERAERAEDDLKAERRRLQREAREALSRVEELETENSHLTKRLDKLKNAKSALLKEL